VNDFGVAGDLRRDERGVVDGLGAWALAQWWFAERWRLAAGFRHSRIDFEVRDDYVTALNPDDSGSRTDQASLPVAGLLHALNERVHLYLSAGRGFETPTLAELAYRPDGQPGLNLALEPTTSSSAEFGLKAQGLGGLRSSLAVFRTDSSNDIVPALNVGGRTTFRNAAGTRRQGLEAGLEAPLARGLNLRAAWTWLDARFTEYQAADGSDLAGNRLPGVPKSIVQAGLSWRDPGSGFVTILEAQWSSSVAVDDVNSASADAWTVVNWSAGYDWRAGGWRIVPYLRVDNLFDRSYVGSVIVNAAAGRYYEPAAGRAGFAGLRLTRNL
jgi:iron complex outermembrane receptor protein